jgi:hypothetical protein
VNGRDEAMILVFFFKAHNILQIESQ